MDKLDSPPEFWQSIGMKFQPGLHATVLVIVVSAPLAHAQFYGDPPDATHPWAVHDMNRPQPPRVEPGNTPGAPPSDAVVLFDGTQAALANWEPVREERKGDWIVKDGTLQCVPGSGYLRTKQEFGDLPAARRMGRPYPGSR